MDNLTHSLVGALIGQAGLKRKTGLAMPALIIGANLPDVDAACFFWLEGAEHLAFRRGITHGPPALVLLPLVLAGLLWAFDRWQTKRGKRPQERLPVHFGWLFALALIGCLSHPALDWLNVYGIRLLEPFSSQWFYGDVLFIIDVWLWALLIVSVWWSRRREKMGRAWAGPARIGLAAVLTYIGVNWLVSDVTEARAATKGAIASPPPVQFWARDVIVPLGEGSWRINQTKLGECALPAAIAAAGENRDLAAFLFWSRAPIAQRAPDGSVLIRDARYADVAASRGFTVALPDVACQPLVE